MEMFVLEIDSMLQHLLRKAEENHDSRSEDRDVILWTPGYEAGVLPLDCDLEAFPDSLTADTSMSMGKHNGPHAR
jgi:hypothetical protein